MAGSATITGRQNYILGIGHPENISNGEAAPALVGGGGGSFEMIRPTITFENKTVTWEYNFVMGAPYTCRFYGTDIYVNSGNLNDLTSYSTVPFDFLNKDISNTTINLNGVEGFNAAITLGVFGTINFPDLKVVYDAANPSFTVHNASGNRVLNTPNLQYVQTLAVSYPALTTKWNAPLLKQVGTLSLSYPFAFAAGSNVAIETAGSLLLSGSAMTTMSIPWLKTIRGNFTCNSVTALASLSMPDAEYIGAVNLIGTGAALTSVSMPKLKEIGAWFIGTSTTAYLPIPATVKKLGSSGIIYSGAATAAQVDEMLAFLVSLDGTNGTTLFGASSFPSGTTITARFDGLTTAPTAAGLASKATLQARGVTVTTK